MNTVNAVTTPATAAAAGDYGMTNLSPDAMLDYCQMQLSGLDGQIDGDIKQQETQLREREAVQKAQSVLSQYGTQGPQDPVAFQKCVDALDQAAASLPPGDTVAAQLQDFKENMCSQYGYDPAKAPTPQQAQEGAEVNRLAQSSPTIIRPAMQQLANQLEGGGLDNPPQNNDWQGTTDALGNIADNIKSGAEIQMLQLQDLVSQRQQAVQLASGIMSKEDQTLEGIAKSIGG
jgi:hypothetical protein